MLPLEGGVKWIFQCRVGLCRSLHGDGFSEVAGLVYVAAAADGDVVGEELEGDYFEDGEEQLGGGGDVDDVVDELARWSGRLRWRWR